MFELRGVAFGCVLWLAACAGGESSRPAARGEGSAPERQRSSAPHLEGGVPLSREGQVVGPRESEPGSLGSNTNWHPIEPAQPGAPLPSPQDPDDPDAPQDPDAPEGGDSDAPAAGEGEAEEGSASGAEQLSAPSSGGIGAGE